MKKFHRLLRGRYWLAVPLAVVGLIAGVVGGWSIAPDPTYRSEAMIHIAPTVPRVLYQNEQNQVPPMFDAFVSAQSRLVQSQRVLSRALENEQLRQVAGDRRIDEGSLRSGLSTVSGGQVIEVRFVDESPEFAQAAVTAIVNAYDEIYGEEDATSDSRRMQILEDRRRAGRSELSSLRDRIAELSDHQGRESLDERYRHRMQEALQIESELRRVRLALMRAERANEDEEDVASAEDELAESLPGVAELDPKALADFDEDLQRLVRQQQELEMRLEESEARYGPRHRETQNTQNSLKVISDRIASYVESNRDSILERMAEAEGLFGAGMGVEQLEQQEQEFASLLESAEEEANELGRRRVQIIELEQDIASAEQQLADVQQRIESLSVEAQIGGRIDIASEGNRPTDTFQDHRVLMAGAAGFGGMSLGLGLIALIGFLDKRCRTPDDTQSDMHQAPLLGILPQLPADLTDLEGASMAAHAVHHIRTLVQIGMQRNRAKVLAMLSPAAGDGKTSLCHAIGLSFAQASSRTLMIDCDLVGGRLSTTATAIARRRIGRILQRDGLVTQQQLDEALSTAQTTGRRIGEILVERGHLTDEHLAAALNAQAHDAMGLLDVAAGEPLENCTVSTGAENLYLLPLGSAEARHAPRLSPTALQQILDRARERFDVVLIDTGPMLGSLEASLVATQADASVMVVSRGSQRPAIERAMQELQRMGATIAGVVFNRATEYDVARYGVSHSGRTSQADQSAPPEALRTASQHYGPMAQAIGSSVGQANGNGYSNGTGRPDDDDADHR